MNIDERNERSECEVVCESHFVNSLVIVFVLAFSFLRACALSPSRTCYTPCVVFTKLTQYVHAYMCVERMCTVARYLWNKNVYVC